jgi:hypothetical protein
MDETHPDTRPHLSANEFIEKVKELLANPKSQWVIVSDIDYDQIRITELVDGNAVSYLSPVIYHMKDEDYLPFRAELGRLLPEADREQGRYW